MVYCKSVRIAWISIPIRSHSPQNAMTDGSNAHRWTCNGILCPATSGPSFALIVLNQPVTRPDILQRLWQNARVKICADGGGNRLHDTLQSLKGGLDGKCDGVADLREA